MMRSVLSCFTSILAGSADALRYDKPFWMRKASKLIVFWNGEFIAAEARRGLPSAELILTRMGGEFGRRFGEKTNPRLGEPVRTAPKGRRERPAPRTPPESP